MWSDQYFSEKGSCWYEREAVLLYLRVRENIFRATFIDECQKEFVSPICFTLVHLWILLNRCVFFLRIVLLFLVV